MNTDQIKSELEKHMPVSLVDVFPPEVNYLSMPKPLRDELEARFSNIKLNLIDYFICIQKEKHFFNNLPIDVSQFLSTDGQSIYDELDEKTRNDIEHSYNDFHSSLRYAMWEQYRRLNVKFSFYTD